MTRQQNLEQIKTYGKLAVKQVLSQRENAEKFLSQHTNLSQADELSQAFKFEFAKDNKGKTNPEFWRNILKQLRNE